MSSVSRVGQVSRWAGSLLFVVPGAMLALATPAAAQGAQEASSVRTVAATERGFEIAATALWFAPPIRGGTNPFGWGFGGRLGGMFSHMYIGGRVAGFLGDSDLGAISRSVVYGGELARTFEFPLGETFFVGIRPRAGVGGVSFIHSEPAAASSTTTTSTRGRRSRAQNTTASGIDVLSGASGLGSGADGSSTTTVVTNVYLEPGISLVFGARTSAFFLTIDASMLVVPGVTYDATSAPSTWLTFGSGAAAGLRF